MTSSSQESRNDPLRQPLRSEALANSPGFSVELQERVLTGLRAKGVHVLPSDMPLPGQSRWRLFRQIAIPLATAAAVAIVAWNELQPGGQRPAPGSVVDGSAGKELPSLDISPYVMPVKTAFGAPTAQAFEQGKYGYLDKDAQRLAIFVAEQIPNLPTGDERPQ